MDSRAMSKLSGIEAHDYLVSLSQAQEEAMVGVLKDEQYG